MNCHFKLKKYDIFKNNAKVKCSIQSFENHPANIFFHKLVKVKDAKYLILASFLMKREYHVSDFFSPEFKKDFTKWKKTQESLTYIVSQEINSVDNIAESIMCDSDNHPKLLKLFLQNKISLETLAIITDVCKCLAYWNKKMKYDIVCADIIFKIKKYLPFLKYNKVVFKNLIKEKIIVDKCCTEKNG